MPDTKVKTVNIQRKQTTLVGQLYYHADGRQHPTIIFCPGLGEDVSFVAGYAQQLAASGYTVYTFDFSGGSITGWSTGSTLEMSIFTEADDLRRVVRVLRQRPEVDASQLYLAGESQGGAVAAMVANDLNQQIAGLLLLYPAFIIPDDARQHYQDIDAIPEKIPHAFMAVGRAYYEPLLNYDIYAHLFDFTRPVLIIHGEADRVVPISYSRRAARYYAQAPLHPIPGAGHGFYGRNEQVAIQLMLAFLSQSQSNL
ncbi:alpha/beta hydrolase [Lactiplantibacillus pentosus]